ncbi:hypothetical protein Pint_29704 [Pistacia integerrima]|uniref:Uncharacterized protein n=1 Tax=Pistacia integerrima TaxID=434235 RepID=A0ACC0X2M8_9ROSI|nr:hypothetical protein Pint_29704 [Pistacia integerrima]
MRRMGEEKEELQHVMTSVLSSWILPQVSTGFRFIKSKTFHLTVLMLKLLNKDRVNAAIEVLKSISLKVMDALDNRPIFVRLKGPVKLFSSSNTAYGINERFFGQSSCTLCSSGRNGDDGRLLCACRINERFFGQSSCTLRSSGRNGDDGRLLCACQVIIDAFNEAGLVLEKDGTQKLKLHATVMNARHRKSKSRTRKLVHLMHEDFKQYGSEEWREYIIPEAHLSQRFVFDESGYYHCCASIPFPENTKAN